MPGESVVELLGLLEQAGVRVWLDGGWGVDALLGTETRSHKDLDVVAVRAEVPILERTLEPRGFAIKEGSPPDSFVLADGSGLEVDVHAVTFDEKGDGIYRMENGQDWVFPAAGFSGRGEILGKAVRCLSPEVAVLCHAHGYTPSEKDFRDMERLTHRFGVALPPQLRRPGWDGEGL